MAPSILFALWLSLLARQIWSVEIIYECEEKVRHDSSYVIPAAEGINLAFVVHKSQNISEKNSQLMFNIVNGLFLNMSKMYSVGDKRYYTARLLLFGDLVKVFNNITYQSFVNNELMSVNNTQGLGEGAHISKAFEEVRNKIGNFYYYNSFAPNLCIVLTTLLPDNQSEAVFAAKSLQESGFTIIVVTVGDEVAVKDVEDLASNKNVVFTVGRSISDEDVETAAEAAITAITVALRHAHVLPSYRYCHKAFVNFFIIIDVSRNNMEMLHQLRKFVDKLNLDRVSLRVMIINSPTSNSWYMRAFLSLVRNANKTWKLETFDSSYDLSSSIRHGRQLLLDFPSYHKNSVREKIVIVVTDKPLKPLDNVISETQTCKNSGIHVMALGIGRNISEDQLSKTISDPRGVTKVDASDDINLGLERLNRNICPGICEVNWWYHDGMCYRLTHVWGAAPWEFAQKVCGDSMSKIVSLSNSEKASWLEESVFEKDHYYSIGLRRHTLDNAPLSREFRWENGKPFVYSNWQWKWLDYYAAVVEPCFDWIAPGEWSDDFCTVGMNEDVLCEKESGILSKETHKVEILPLWEEKACPLPQFASNRATGPFLATGKNCKPVLDVHMNIDRSHFHSCDNGELISKYLLCDGLAHCLDASDELNCSSKCTEYQFPCSNGRCISLAYTCDVWDDCDDNSDETDCAIVPCSADEWQCDSGQCIPEDARCDLYYDCYDKSDEASCADICKQDRCSDGTCLPWHWIRDQVSDCNFYDDEIAMKRYERCYTGRYRELFYLFVNPEYENERPDCCMVFDGFGKHFDSYYNSDKNCSDEYSCPIGFYKCPSSYCIPIEKVCNGIMDCVDGEEELGCGNYECPGYFRCPFSTYCHHPARLCDGDADCPGGRDEVMCDFSCPDNCTCIAGVVQCKNLMLKEQNQFDPRTRKLLLTQSSISDQTRILKFCYYLREASLTDVGLFSFQGMLNDLSNLRKLNVSQNHLTEIPGHIFSHLEFLETLDISHNPLRRISSNSFVGLKKLQNLVIKHTSLVELERGYFSLLVNLKVLDIGGNPVHTVSNGAFNGLQELNSLNMQDNPVVKYEWNAFSGLDALQELQTSIHFLCCPQVRPKHLAESKCVSPKSEISSCNDLLANGFMRSSIWILCTVSLIGNVVCIVARIVLERASMRHGIGIFLTQLEISNFLMGVYLLIIVIEDMKFRGQYMWHDSDWRQSSCCRLAGALATTSLEASAVFTCLITLNQLLVLKFPNGQLRHKSAITIAILAWILAVIIATLPLIPSFAHWNFYRKTGACMEIPFFSQEEAGWIYSVIIFIGMNCGICVLIVCGQLCVYRAKHVSMVSPKEGSGSGLEMAVAQRLLLIVVTDFFCWLTVGVMSVLALTGMSISKDMYAWTAVFILPANSALNPILYAIPTVLKKVRHSKRLPTTKETVKATKLKASVELDDLGTNQRLLNDVLMKMNVREDRFNLIMDVLGKVKDSFQTDASVQPQPNTVYLGMRGKVVERVSLATREDASCIDPILECLYLLYEMSPLD